MTVVKIYAATVGHDGNPINIGERNDDDDDNDAAAAGDRRNTRNRNSKPLLGRGCSCASVLVAAAVWQKVLTSIPPQLYRDLLC